MFGLFKRNMIKPATIDEVAQYGFFDPKPSLVGATNRGVLVYDERTDNVATITPRLETRNYAHGGSLTLVEFDPVAHVTPDISTRNYDKKRALKAATLLMTGGLGLLVMGCGCGEDPSDDDPTPNPVVKPACNDGIDNDGDNYIDFPADVGCTSATANSENAAPGQVTDLQIQTGPTTPEAVYLKWTGVGDGEGNNPVLYIVRHSTESIDTLEKWDAAGELTAVDSPWDAGVMDGQTYTGIPAGPNCFATRALDAQGLYGPLSNSPCADVIGKSEAFLNYWADGSDFLQLPYNWTGDSEAAELIDTNVELLADHMILASGPSFPGTRDNLRDLMMLYTDGVFDPTETNNALDPFGAGNFELVDGNYGFVWDVSNPANLNVSMSIQTQSGITNQFYNNLPNTVLQPSMDIIHEVVMNSLLNFLDRNPALFNDYALPPNPTACDPGWGNPANKDCGN